MQIIRQAAVALIVILIFLPGNSVFADTIKVEVAKSDSGFHLTRGGKPYVIKGAGLELKELGPFTSHGGNSIRTWRTDNGGQTGQELLDDAEKHGVTVALCIEIGRERLGFDYNDEAAVAAQFEYARGEVMKYKDHPALLTWIVGNEPNLSFKNPKVFDAINDISKMIHELDKNHPTTTALAGFNAELAKLIETRTPDLDFVSIQMYGDIVNLPRYIKEIGFDTPYLVTEWGSIGHWEVRKTAWGAPVEQNSSEKAANYLKSYKVAIASDPERILGSYVFYWGQKQERTPTWYGMFLEDGSETETIDVMQYIWTGAWPDNRSPQIDKLLFDSQSSPDDIVVHAGESYSAEVKARDPDGDELHYAWEIKRESEATEEGGDREEIPETINGLIDNPDSKSIAVTAPDQAGAYRLFVYIRDGKGHAGHANLPFLVK